MTNKNDKNIEKNIEKKFAEYITKTYNNTILENINSQPRKDDLFTEERPLDTSNFLAKTCQGCIDGQPNQEAHTYWGGCLSMLDENTTAEDENTNQYDSDSESYCSTTSYESDGDNATTTAIAVETASYDGPLGPPSESSILSRRFANSI